MILKGMVNTILDEEKKNEDRKLEKIWKENNTIISAYKNPYDPKLNGMAMKMDIFC